MADTATQQVSTQEAAINGDNNQVIQVINQVTIEQTGRGRGPRRNGSSATVQDAYQGVSVDGSGNVVYQESSQINESHNSDRPGRRVGQGGAHPVFDGDDDDDDDDDDRRNRGRNRDWDDDDDDDDDD
ncbi:hypothetical protein C7271_09020 [filamentous cyanobacterium CCP5]|nr:hypothetical protein C7271_09020 [filamentous cyanobacterium CCP5]